jgi:hypothetical protein
LNFFRNNKIPLVIALLCGLLYSSFAYDLVRHDFAKLITLFGALFFISFKLVKVYGENFQLLAAFGVLFRLLLLFAIPNLSQDFYRFLWDGRLMAQGMNPYLFTPEMIMTGATSGVEINVHQATILFEGMGGLNASHFSNYPPVNQLCFTVAGIFSGQSILGSVMVLRVMIILADIGILYFGKKLLEQMRLPVASIFIFFLNPFIIIELSGNLHFEGVMLFFMIWSLYLLFKGKWFWAAVLFGLSVSVKLIPLLFLPLFYSYFVEKGLFGKGFWQLNKFMWTILITIILCFLPFLSAEFAGNFFSTIQLWFQDFEFNASVFYIIRWIGFETVGWDPIQTAGKVLPIIVFVFVLTIAFFRKNGTPQKLLSAMLWAIVVYLLLATTIHPWYVATPVLLSVFTRFRFALLWSAVVMLSYAAYTPNGFSENLWLVAAEYTVLLGYICWELFRKKQYSNEVL